MTPKDRDDYPYPCCECSNLDPSETSKWRSACLLGLYIDDMQHCFGFAETDDDDS